MLPVKFQNCRFSTFIEEGFHICFQVLTHDARRTHWYGNSLLWPFGPGELKTSTLLYVMFHGYTFRDSNTVIFIFVSLHYWCSPPQTESTCKGKTLLAKLQDLPLIVHLVWKRYYLSRSECRKYRKYFSFLKLVA